MDDEKNQQQDQRLSRIVIEFPAPGVAVFRVTFDGTVTSGQMVAVGEYITEYGKMQYQLGIAEELRKEMEKRQMQSIVTPGRGGPS